MSNDLVVDIVALAFLVPYAAIIGAGLGLFTVLVLASMLGIEFRRKP